MDFRRIEAIFLVVFIALDIFLFATFNQKGSDVSYSDDTALSTKATVAKNMKDDKITTGKLSTTTHNGYYLASETSHILNRERAKLYNQTTTYSADNQELTSQFNTPLQYSKKTRVKKLTKFIQSDRHVRFGKHYVYVPALSDNKDVIIFAQKIKQGLITDSQGMLTFNLSNGVITGYTQTYLPKVTVLREKQTTISAKEAVSLLYTTGDLPQNSKIVWCQFGYSELMDVRGSIIYVPVWNVMIQRKGTKNETLKRVNALTKTVIKNSSDDDSSSSSQSSSRS